MLAEQPPYRDVRPFDVPPAVLALLARRLRETVAPAHVRAFTFGAREAVEGLAGGATFHEASVDAYFSLQRPGSAERLDAVITVGLRDSRFALVLFWEILHALRVGGVWIDLDRASSLLGTSVCAQDIFARPAFTEALVPLLRESAGEHSLSVWRKTAPALAETGTGNLWTFGVLTSADSPCAARMIEQLLALAVTGEVLVAGPLPSGTPADPRVRQFDLEQPNARGWITRKKNLVIAQASFDNLGLLHDRYMLPSDLGSALGALGCPGVFTFPQIYFPTYDRVSFSRHLDYQAKLPHGDLDKRLRLGAYRPLGFPTPGPSPSAYPAYNDFHEYAFCAGGALFSRTRVFRAILLDERLHHNEYEDVEYGIRCHRMGVPHRVNPLAVLESVYGQHFNVWQISGVVLAADGSSQECRTRRSAVELAERVLARKQFKPLSRTDVESLRATVSATTKKLPQQTRSSLAGLTTAVSTSPARLLAASAKTVFPERPATRAEALALLELGRAMCAGPPFQASLLQAWCRKMELDDQAWRAFSMQWSRHFRTLALLGAGPILGELDLARATWLSRSGGLTAKLLRLGQWLHMRSPVSRAAFGPTGSLGTAPSLAAIPAPAGRGLQARMLVPLAIALLPVERALGTSLASRLARRAKDLVLRSRQARRRPTPQVDDEYSGEDRADGRPTESKPGAGLRPLTLRVGRRRHNTVMVSARGLWDRFAAPASADAWVRSYQRTVPALVKVSVPATPGAINPAEVHALMERCAASASACVAVPFILDAASKEVANALLASPRMLPGCKLAQAWPALGRSGVFPVIDLHSGSHWAWRVPIETVTHVPCDDLARTLDDLGAERVVVDSVNVLTRIADARAFSPDYEERLLDRIAAIKTMVEIWRTSDLLEAEVLNDEAS